MERFKDSVGNEIFEGDLIRMFHFTGIRKKRHYMYKKVGEYSTTGIHLKLFHTDGKDPDISFSIRKDEYINSIIVIQRGKFHNNEHDNLKRNPKLRD